MTPSLKHIITSINDSLASIYQGARFFGIAKHAMVVNTEKIYPYVDEKYIGIDDAYALTIYHRLNSMTSQLVRNSGYGDGKGNQSNVYNLSMVVHSNKKLTRMEPDELFLLIQSRLSNLHLSGPAYRSISVSVTSAVLDSQIVYAGEYPSSEYSLFGHQNLMAINYQLETVFKPGCFINCPEDIICN